MKQKKRHGSKKMVQKLVKTNYYASFFLEEKNKKENTQKEHKSL